MDKLKKDCSSVKYSKKKIYWNKGFTKETNDKVKQSGLKISSSLKKYFSNPQNRLKTSITTKKGMNTPEIKEKCAFWKGKKLSKKHIANVVKAKIGKKLKPRTKEHSRKLSQALKGRHLTDEHKNKIKLNALTNENYGMRGKRQTRHAKIMQGRSMRGKHHTLKARQSISRNGKGKHLGPFTLEHRMKIKENRIKQIMPIKDTSIEIKIQNYLKELGIEFYTHQYMKEIEHSYQCDIFIPVQKFIEQKTIIECDGNYWHNYPEGLDKDKIRTEELIEQGFRVIRLWESEINTLSSVELKNKLENKMELIENEN